MEEKRVVCPDCDGMDSEPVDRRDFMKGAAAASITAAGLWSVPRSKAAPTAQSAPETAVKALYETLSPDQKKDVCFDWDFKNKRGLLRMHVSNNWQITNRQVASNFFTNDQRELIRKIYEGILNPEWVKRIDKQLKDDTGGKAWGAGQAIAIFGKPGSDKFKLVMTGRHMTIRCDGNSEAHVPWGGPIFHGHAASGFNEKVGHPGNVFWHQAQEANNVYKILDGKQQKLALVPRRPAESSVGFKGPDGKRHGLPVADMTKDQKAGVKKVLLSLIDPYRKEDQQEILKALEKQGGLDKCNLAFYRDGDLGDDGEWDNWRLEGPAFVWYFRGHPHVHIWVNIADDPSVPLNARG